MKKRIFIILLSGVLLAGCGRQGQPEAEKQTTETTAVESETIREEMGTTEENAGKTETGRISRESDGVLLVDAEVELPGQGLEQVKRLVATNRDYREQEQLRDILVPDGAAESWTTNEDGSWSYYDSGNHANVGVSIQYSTAHYDTISTYGPHITEGFPDTWFERDKELEFLSIGEACGQLEAFLETLDIRDVEIKEIYSADMEKMQSLQAERMGEEDYQAYAELGKIESSVPWSKEDEYYLFEIIQKIDGIPIKEFAYMRQDYSMIPGGLLEAAWGQEGLEYLLVLATYEKISEETVKILSAEEILESVREKVDLMILDSEAVVKKLRTIYYPVLAALENRQFTLNPAWEVTVEIQGSEGTFYFDAESGKELVY